MISTKQLNEHGHSEILSLGQTIEKVENLIKAKEDRLHLSDTISEEKEAISKKTEGEKLKL